MFNKKHLQSSSYLYVATSCLFMQYTINAFVMVKIWPLFTHWQPVAIFFPLTKCVVYASWTQALWEAASFGIGCCDVTAWQDRTLFWPQPGTLCLQHVIPQDINNQSIMGCACRPVSTLCALTWSQLGGGARFIHSSWQIRSNPSGPLGKQGQCSTGAVRKAHSAYHRGQVFFFEGFKTRFLWKYFHLTF